MALEKAIEALREEWQTLEAARGPIDAALVDAKAIHARDAKALTREQDKIAKAIQALGGGKPGERTTPTGRRAHNAVAETAQRLGTATKREIAREAGLTATTATRWLKELEGAGYLTVTPAAKPNESPTVRWRADATFDSQMPGDEAINETTRTIERELQLVGTATAPELSERLGLADSTVYAHLERLHHHDRAEHNGGHPRRWTTQANGASD